MALYGAFCNRELKNVLSFMQASGSKEEEEEEERTGCSRQTKPAKAGGVS